MACMITRAHRAQSGIFLVWLYVETYTVLGRYDIYSLCIAAQVVLRVHVYLPNILCLYRDRMIGCRFADKVLA